MFYKYQAMKTYGGVEVQLQTFLISALDEGEWSASLLTTLPPGDPRHSLYRSLDGPQSRYGRCGEEKSPYLKSNPDPSMP
jgi:hypothetical protein